MLNTNPNSPLVLRVLVVAALLLTTSALILGACSPIDSSSANPTPSSIQIDYAGTTPEGSLSRIGKGKPAVLALSDDGNSLAVGSNVGLYLFGAHSLEELWSLPSNVPVSAVEFSSDGQLLAFGLENGTLFLVDVETGSVVNSLDGGGESGVQSLAWQAIDESGSQLLATGFNDGTLILSSIDREEATPSVGLEGVLGRSSTGVTAIAFSPNGRILVSGNRSGTVQFWDTQSMELVVSLEGHEARQTIQSLRWSSEGDVLYSGADDGRVIIWDILAFEPEEVIDAHPGGVLAISPSSNDSMLSSTGVDGSISFWATSNGSNLSTRDGGAENLETAAISGDGTAIAGVTEDGNLHVWKVDQNKISPTAVLEGFVPSNIWARSTAWSPSGDLLAEGLWDQVVIWDPDQNKPVLTLEGHDSLVTGLAWSPDGDRIASASRDKTVILWDGQSGESLLTLSGHTSGVTDIAWSPGGTRLASTGSLDNTVIVWDVETGEQIESLAGPDEGVWSVAWSPDGKTLAVGTMLGEVLLWDAENLADHDIISFLAHLNWVSDLAWSSDGTRLATAGADYRASVRDIESGQRTQTFAGHSGVVAALAFSPDGTMLATSSVDHLVIVWEIGGAAEARSPLAILSGHSAEVDSISWSPDGSQLASASRDGTMLLWDVGGVINS